LVCSVTVEHNVMVELTWVIPNNAAINENRVVTPNAVTPFFVFWENASNVSKQNYVGDDSLIKSTMCP
jgi:UDP-3-O-[3-hydroxymyristoyl] glucosamine N-acyltransferase